MSFQYDPEVIEVEPVGLMKMEQVFRGTEKYLQILPSLQGNQMPGKMGYMIIIHAPDSLLKLSPAQICQSLMAFLNTNSKKLASFPFHEPFHHTAMEWPENAPIHRKQIGQPLRNFIPIIAFPIMQVGQEILADWFLYST